MPRAALSAPQRFDLPGGDAATAQVRGDLEGDRRHSKSMTLRGLTIKHPRRGGFLRAATALMDSFDVARVDALGGSNSLLFGPGDAGGVITTHSKRATLGRARRGSLAAGEDSEGGRRYTLDTGPGFKHRVSPWTRSTATRNISARPTAS